MNRSKKLYVLLGVLAVFCVMTFLVSRYEEKKEQIKNSDEVILKIDSEKVTELSWKYDSESLSFHKDEEWTYDDDKAFPVDAEKMDELLEVFAEFGVSFIIEDVEDYSQYGLDHPTCEIKIKDDEKTYEVAVGDYSTMDSERYVSIGDGNVYLVSEDPMDTYEITLDDVMLHDVFPNFNQVDKVTFKGKQKYEINYVEDSKYTYCDEDVYFVEKDDKTLPLDTTKVTDYTDMIGDLDLTSYVTYNVTDEELETYGLDNPELIVSIQYSWEDDETEETVSDTFKLSIAQDPEQAGTIPEDSDEEEEIIAYARVGESKIIYKLTSNQYENLLAASYDDLRHKEVLTADFDDIQKIDITLEGNSYTITSEEGEEEDEQVYVYETEEIDISSFKTALTSLEAYNFATDEPSDKEEIKLTVYLNDENFPKVEIELYRHNGEYCMAVVDGETFALVDRNDVVDLIEAVNAIVL